jgi:hypothetical protein
MHLPGVGTNRYAYSDNDPINKSDPSGHVVIPVAAAVAVTGLVAIAVSPYGQQTARQAAEATQKAVDAIAAMAVNNEGEAPSGKGVNSGSKGTPAPTSPGATSAQGSKAPGFTGDKAVDSILGELGTQVGEDGGKKGLVTPATPEAFNDAMASIPGASQSKSKDGRSTVTTIPNQNPTKAPTTVSQYGERTSTKQPGYQVNDEEGNVLGKGSLTGKGDSDADSSDE